VLDRAREGPAAPIMIIGMRLEDRG